MLSKDATKARHAKQSWRLHTRWLYGAAALLIAIAAGFIGAGIGARHLEPTVIEKVEYRDWPVYVDQTPAKCYEAMDAADEMLRIGLKSDDMTLKAAGLAAAGARNRSPAKLVKAAEATADAKKIGKDLAKARQVYIDLAGKCKE